MKRTSPTGVATRRRVLPPLFRPRRLWLPTWWGWSLLLAILVVLIGTLGASAHRLLAVDAPARGPDGRGARTLIVEGWLEPPELMQAIAAFRRGRYDRVLTTGGPIDPWMDAGGWKNFALRAAEVLRANGLANASVIAVPAPDTALDRTWLSAVMVREWARRSNVTLDAVDVYSAGAHTRRSRAVYRLALGDGVEVGAMAAPERGIDSDRWWTSSAGAKAVLGETVSLVWTTCCFWPPRR